MLPELRNYVLFVDDDDDDREMIQLCCEQLNFAGQARFLSSGESLFCFLSSISHPDDYPSLIVLDVNMPGMNGDEALLKLKEHPRFGHIPVVIYSTGSQFPSRYTAMGAEAFCRKASNYDQLKRSVSNFFARLTPSSLS